MRTVCYTALFSKPKQYKVFSFCSCFVSSTWHPMENAEALRAIVVCKYGAGLCCLDQSLWKQVLVQYTLSSAFSAQCQKHLFSRLHFHESKLILYVPCRCHRDCDKRKQSFWFAFAISNIKINTQGLCCKSLTYVTSCIYCTRDECIHVSSRDIRKHSIAPASYWFLIVSSLHVNTHVISTSVCSCAFALNILWLVSRPLLLYDKYK